MNNIKSALLMSLFLLSACGGPSPLNPSLSASSAPDNKITPRTKGSTLSITPRTKGSTLLKGRIQLPSSMSLSIKNFNILIDSQGQTQKLQSNEKGFFGLTNLAPQRYTLRAQSLYNPHLILTAVIEIGENQTTHIQDISLRSTVIQKLVAHAQKTKSPLQTLSIEEFNTNTGFEASLKALENVLMPYLGQKMQMPVESMPEVESELQKAQALLEKM